LRRWAVQSSDLTLALAIWGCAALYIELTRPVERVREHASSTPQIDLNSMWTFSAVLLIHPALVAAIVLANYLHRWLRVRHHVVHRQMFSAVATVLGSYTAYGVLVAAHLHPIPAGPTRSVAACIVIIIAAIAFHAVSTALVSGAIVLSMPRPTLAAVAADPGDTALGLAGSGLGVLVAWALLDWPAALAIIFGVSLVLHGKVLVRQLRDAARTDPKTGLLNMPAWTNAAERQLVRAGEGRLVGLLLVDLDHFKLVNDVHGQLLGDEVLVAVTMAITEEVRALGRIDLVGRFGGEEFVVLLGDADMTTTVATAERIRQRIGAIPIIATSPTLRVTCSVGAASYPLHGTNLPRLLQAADTALHTAKRSGRNQVRLAGPS
jgi:diguanylate cyclase (GGDEF)-like protein